MRLSLLCMCQMNHKPIPYAIAICWWAQAVLVDIKSWDYEGLILSEWRERRTGRQAEWRRERWRVNAPSLLFYWSTGHLQWKGSRRGYWLTPPKCSNLTKGCAVLVQPGGMWEQTNNGMCTQTTTCLSPCPQCPMMVIGVAVKNKRDKALWDFLLLSFCSVKSRLHMGQSSFVLKLLF